MKRQISPIDTLSEPSTSKKTKATLSFCSTCGESYTPSDVRTHAISDEHKKAVMSQIFAKDRSNKQERSVLDQIPVIEIDSREKGIVLHKTTDSRILDVLFLPAEDVGRSIAEDGGESIAEDTGVSIADTAPSNEPLNPKCAIHPIEDFMKQCKPGLLERLQQAVSLPSSVKVNCTLRIKIRKLSDEEKAAVEDILLITAENHEVNPTSDCKEYIEQLSEMLKNKFENSLHERTEWQFGNIIDMVFHFNDYSPFCTTCGESYVSNHLRSHVRSDKHKRNVLNQIIANDGDSKENGYVLHRTADARGGCKRKCRVLTSQKV